MKQIQFNDVFFVIGQNQQDNWDILSQAKQNEWFFHLDKLPSCYVIVKTDELTTALINHAAFLCKENSKFNMTVKIIYTQVKNVSKGTKIGQAIIKGKTKNIVL